MLNAQEVGQRTSQYGVIPNGHYQGSIMHFLRAPISMSSLKSLKKDISSSLVHLTPSEQKKRETSVSISTLPLTYTHLM